MLAMGAARHDRVTLAAGKIGQRLGQRTQVAQDDGVGGLDLHHQPGVGHILGRRTPVYVAAGGPFA